MDFHIEPSIVRGATVTVPGDKSISHRAVMLGSLADGVSEIRGFLAGEDCKATLRAFADMGVRVDQHTSTSLTIHGVGMHGLTAPKRPLDLGNSGTAMRLMAGLMAGQSFSTELVGDESLSGRPMARIINPLTEMGAVIESDCDGTPPLQIRGGVRLHGIDYALPVASAQVKSCLLLAGLYAEGRSSIQEPAITRDHTERMLSAMGVTIDSDDGRITMRGPQRLTATDIDVPGDLSSAAFVILAAILADDAEVIITNVGVNPTRTGVIDILKAMGADIRLENSTVLGQEPVADLRIRSSALQGCDVGPDLVSLAIDEFPALFVAAASARGVTTFSGIGELRVKESDRIAAMSAGLRALGIRVEESEDSAIVHGGTFTGGRVQSFGDHRIAMSFAVAGSIAESTVAVQDVANVETSFPGFADLMRSLRLTITEEQPA